MIAKDNRVVSTGYNGTPSGQLNCWDGGCPRGQLAGDLPEDYERHPCNGLHAEANALLRAGREAEGATLYCTHKPCLQCQNLIMGADVYQVIWPEWNKGLIFPGDKPELKYWSVEGLIK